MYRPSLRHMRSIHGQLPVSCCDVMWYCVHVTSVMRLLTADRWLLNAVYWLLTATADCSLLTADFCLRGCNKQILEEQFWNSTKIVIYIESKVTAVLSQVLRACRRSRDIAPPTLKFSVRCRWTFSLTLLLFYNQRYRTEGQLDRQPGRTFWRRERYPVSTVDRPQIFPAPWT
jgi:uncharacterized membrane protein YwaF